MSKNIFRPLVVATAPALLLLPRIDAFFNATMPRKALAEPVLLLCLGWLSSRLLARTAGSTAWPVSAAITAATVLELFWMIPRSLDLTQIYPAMNDLYVFSLFAVGFLLTRYLPRLSGVARAAYALNASSMIVAAGLLYAAQSTLLCSAFTLQDQRAFGWMIVPVGLLVYVLTLAAMPHWLAPGVPKAAEAADSLPV